MNQDLIIDMNGVYKSFPGVKALDNVDLKVRRGEVHALLGENGAGKSTLIKIISGIYDIDAGKVLFDGKELKNVTPFECTKLGISVVHQELKMVDALTVAENIFLGRPFEKRSFFGSKEVDWKKMRIEAQKLIDEMGIKIDIDANVSSLSVSKKQIVEICKAISRDSKLIIMDEPSATLTQYELDILFKIIDKLKSKGITIIYISHRLDEIFRIADRATILRDGKYITTLDVSKTNKNELITYMVGREIINIYPEKKAIPGDVFLSVKGLERKGVLKNINFELKRGEILGIAGLVGAGRTELARALMGVDPIDGGEITIRGKIQRIKNIRTAIKLKMALVPEERKVQGIIPDMSISQNVTIIGIKQVIKMLFINNKKEEEGTNFFVKTLRIATPSIKTTIKNLSGGNQQKCVLAKWLFVDSDIIIFDEPTRGIDVGAKQEIYKLLDELAVNGKGIIMISSELPEVLGMSDRILVMHDGRITAEVNAKDVDQEKVMYYATL